MDKGKIPIYLIGVSYFEEIYNINKNRRKKQEDIICRNIMDKALEI